MAEIGRDVLAGANRRGTMMLLERSGEAFYATVDDLASRRRPHIIG